MPASGYPLHVAIPALQAPENARQGGDERGAATTDEQLVQRCRAGSEAAFAEIVARHEAALRRHCARILGRSAAEDAVQDAFVSAWLALRANASVSELRPWLMVIARRKALTLKRRSRYTSELTDAIPGARSSAQDAAQAARAREALVALAALPSTQREALIGSALHGRSGAQLARQLGVTEPTVRQLVFRARDQMRRAMPACLAPPLAFLRLIRRVGASAGRAATAPGPFATGTVLKVASVLVVGAGAVGAGETLTSGSHVLGAHSGHARAGLVATSHSVASARGSLPGATSLTAKRRHSHPLSPPPVQHVEAGSPAISSVTSTPRTTSAVALAPLRSQEQRGGGIAASPAAPVRRVDRAVAGVGAHVREIEPVIEKTVKPPLVNSLVGSAAHTAVDGVAGALAATAQTAASAGQTVAAEVPAVVNATAQVAQGVLASAQSAGAAVQGAPAGVTGVTGVTGVAAPVVSGLDGVVQNLGTTGASGTVHVPGIG